MQLTNKFQGKYVMDPMMKRLIESCDSSYMTHIQESLRKHEEEKSTRYNYNFRRDFPKFYPMHSINTGNSQPRIVWTKMRNDKGGKKETSRTLSPHSDRIYHVGKIKKKRTISCTIKL